MAGAPFTLHELNASYVAAPPKTPKNAIIQCDIVLDFRTPPHAAASRPRNAEPLALGRGRQPAPCSP